MLTLKYMNSVKILFLNFTFHEKVQKFSAVQPRGVLLNTWTRVRSDLFVPN